MVGQNPLEQTKPIQGIYGSKNSLQRSMKEEQIAAQQVKISTTEKQYEKSERDGQEAYQINSRDDGSQKSRKSYNFDIDDSSSADEDVNASLSDQGNIFGSQLTSTHFQPS